MFILKNDLLYYLKNLDIGGFLMKLIRYLFLIIDSAIYSFISYAYQMFSFMSQIRIFESDEMKDIANRVYILIGVIAMFFVAYALICAIINPENATKGKNSSITGIVKNIIFAIIGIAIVPSIFNYAYDFQKTVLCSNLIEKLFLGNNVNSDSDSNANMGNQLELLLFKSFYYIAKYEEDTGDGTTISNTNGVDDSVWATVAQNITNYNNNKSLYDAFQSIESGEGTIAEELNGFDVSVHEGTIKYLFLLSTIAGLYCAYVLLGFVIDMGVRSVKLAYLQLIAPLPIFSMVIPGQKKVFDNWLKKTTSCFMEVFVRVIAMTFAFYAIKYLRPWIFGKGMNKVVCGANTIGGATKLLAQAVYILGIFAFLKQLPKFISDLLPGFDSKGFKLGLGNALAETGGLQMLGAAGGMVTAGTRNLSATGRKVWNNASTAWKNGDKKGAIFKGLGGAAATAASTVAGAASGGARAFIKGKDSKKWSDVAKYAGEGADAAMEAKLKREEYRDAHNDGKPFWNARAHLNDVRSKVGSFLSPDEAMYSHLQKSNKNISTVTDALKAADTAAGDVVTKNESNAKFIVKKFKFKDSSGIEHDVDNNSYTIAELRKMAEHQSEIAKQTGNQYDMAKAISMQNQLDAIIKAGKKEVLSGNLGTDEGLDGKQHMNAAVYNSLKSVKSALEENKSEILNNIGYDQGTPAYDMAINAIDKTLSVNISDNNPDAFKDLGEIISGKNGLSTIANTSKNHVTAEMNELANKIQEKKDSSKK